MDEEAARQLLSKYDNSTKLFSLAGTRCWCRLVELHDADTCHIVFSFQNQDVHKIIVRLLGVDSPEMGSADPVVKAWAVRARNRMLSVAAPGVFEVDGSYTKKDINGLLRENVTMLWLNAEGYDKFGRLLGHLHLSPTDPKTIQSVLIDEGFCKNYNGGKKQPWVPANCVLGTQTPPVPSK
jgi:endonuclease YncB( thermonuclease family)